MRLRFFASLAVTASAALTASAAAQAPADLAVRVVYEAPAGCPDEAGFRSELAARVKHVRFAGPEELARIVRVVVESTAERSRARVDLTDVDGQQVRREVQAGTCAEVVSAIALVTALGIDARLEQDSDERRAPTPQPTSAPSNVDESPKPDATLETRPTPDAEQSPAWAFGLGGGFATGMAPDGLLLLKIFAGLTLDQRWEGRLVASYGFGQAVRHGASFRFRAAWARVEGCWLALRVGAGGSLGPCAGFEGGGLYATGVEQLPRIAQPKSATEPWLAAVGLGRMRLAQQIVFVEVQGELIVPVVRHTFVLEEPPAKVHAFPVLAVGASLAVGVLVE